MRNPVSDASCNATVSLFHRETNAHGTVSFVLLTSDLLLANLFYDQKNCSMYLSQGALSHGPLIPVCTQAQASLLEERSHGRQSPFTS